MTDLSNYGERVDQLDPDLILGRVVWYALSEKYSYMDHSTFCRSVHDQGMTWHLPPVVRPHDLFRRVTTDAQRRKVPIGLNGDRANFNFREVGSDDEHIWRQLVAEVINKAGHRVSYQVLHEVVFQRDPVQISDRSIWEEADALTMELDLVVPDILAELRANFITNYNMITPLTIREYVRKIIRGCGATVLRDGVYFIRGHNDEIDALDAVVNVIPGAMFHSLPLIDDRKQREMLRQAFEDESVGEIDKLINEVTEILREHKKITSRRFGDFIGRYSELRTKMADYSDLLDTALVGTATRLEVVGTTLGELANRVE